MQDSIHKMIGYGIRATDGDLGKLYEFYFDDETWTIRYMVVETGNWLSGRKVLISVVALGKPDVKSQTFSVNLTCDQVRNSPDIDTQRPVNRQHEVEIHKYYQWPIYWQSSYGSAFGITEFPMIIPEDPFNKKDSASGKENNPHLRSTKQVTGYHIHAKDGSIGHVEDFMVDDDNWKIRFLVVDIGKWLPGRKVILSPKWVRKVEWADSSVYLDLTKESVKNSPVFDASQSVTPEYEDDLNDHYGRRPIVHH
ncbi:MAG: PRC-barrel domain-containing protein [Candidatus Margulisiibacteriota bacterium]